MALTKDDIQAIGALLDSRISPVSTQLDAMRTDIAMRLDGMDAQLGRHAGRNRRAQIRHGQAA